MGSPGEYRKHAEECVRLAQTARAPHRILLLEMAQRWIEIADLASIDGPLDRHYPNTQEDGADRPVTAAQLEESDRRDRKSPAPDGGSAPRS